MDQQGNSQALTHAGRESSPPLEQLLAEIQAESEGQEGPGSADGTKASSEDRHHGAEQYIRFVLDGVHFAVPLKRSLEVGRLPGITPLPNLPSWVSGISNIRGEVVSLIDLKCFFGRCASSGMGGEHMILLYTPQVKVGVRVDHLMGIVSLSDAESKVTLNPFTHGDTTPYLSGVVATDDELLYLLDVEKLLMSAKMNSFQRA
ncbi:hypothetical protein DSLASN_32610 [Desulfoluna limicola]|uniref:CheW-like domain-containing protein n=1 Tax=Desulfoluna limicola TaxID=2810562 RepID=A0ABN6FA26_9BACT|nr:chemotaxis protein CheW [Desulfoluna limicola]BCS97629.1 hypothetical protein DSLASN_32610 [Desulfoluna limicola]